jgi:hypothetical protein
MSRLACTIAAVFGLGCTSQPDAIAPPPAPAAAPRVAAGARLSPSGVGQLRGRVLFDGTVPPSSPLPLHQDSQCGAPEGRDESIQVNPDRTLRNAVVRIVSPLPGEWPMPRTPLELSQVGCIYRPRVQAGRIGQEIRVHNGDRTFHNVHTFEGAETWFNRAQPAGVPPIRATLRDGIGLVTFRCDVHPWMRAYVAVSAHPFFAVTTDEGRFSIRDVPAGEHMLEAWHEKLGARTLRLTVQPGQSQEVELRLGPAAPPGGPRT